LGKRTIFTAICLFLIIIIYKFAYLEKKDDTPLAEVIFKQTVKEAMEIYSPSLLYIMAQSSYQNEEIQETINQNSYHEEYKEPEEDIYTRVLNENITYENTKQQDTTITSTDEFAPVQTPVAVYLKEQLQDPKFVKQTFYNEDPTTYISDEQLDYDTLIGYDATLKQTSEAPQILIYHTHSQEAYIDSQEGEVSDSIMGVGERLATILTTKYGYNVIHHMGKYDVESRDYAYSKAMEGISTVLENNPSIEVIIDLHRDETNSDTKLVTTIQGRQTAKFMFFNGLCYTRELGKLENLNNPYIQENLSFAFQMQLFADEYYPGLTRRIYLKGYRYNMHYRPKSLLIELGSQTNTVEEAMNACEPIAHIISSVLNGNNK
jgi:stage II sporulation protein P